MQYGVATEAFTDAIKIMVYKNDRLGKMYECQLYPQPGGVLCDDLVLPGITPTPLIGASLEDSAGGLYASVIASMVARQSPDDTRKLLIGMGPLGPRQGSAPSKDDREELLFVVKLVESCRVW